MSRSTITLARPPIVEAVLDLDCDMPSAWNVAMLEGPSRETFRDGYPRFRTQLLQGFQIEQQEGAEPRFSSQRGIQALQFLSEDERQLVQVRAQGFSFNRLAPYTSLDDYLPEIERTWRLFTELASPVQVRVIRLRYINRVMLPLAAGWIDLDDYFLIGPRLPDEQTLVLRGFLNQQIAEEKSSGHQVTINLAAQPTEQNGLPVILDIAASSGNALEPDNWDRILDEIKALRALKNRVFYNSLTERCLELYR